MRSLHLPFPEFRPQPVTLQTSSLLRQFLHAFGRALEELILRFKSRFHVSPTVMSKKIESVPRHQGEGFW